MKHFFYERKDKMNASIAIQILPMNLNTPEVVTVVDKVIEYIQSQNVAMLVGPFETTMEGEINQLLDILKNCILIAGELHDAIFSNVKISYHSKGILSIEDKVSKYSEK